jgi:hypothetical protein
MTSHFGKMGGKSFILSLEWWNSPVIFMMRNRIFISFFGLAFGLVPTNGVEAAPKPKTPAKTSATPMRRAGYVVGRVTNSAGKPLAGAEISIFGTTARGDRTRFDALTGANGLFSQRVPDGIYGVGAQWKTTYNGKNYTFNLAPDDGKTGVIHDAADGIVKNFKWKIAGLKPGERAGEPNTHTEVRKYYGGYVYVTAQEKGFGGDFIYFPRGSTLVMTLTPRAKLIDGSVGTPKIFRRKFESDITSNFSWHGENIPIGLYTLTAQLQMADGTIKPLNVKRSADFSGAFTPSVPVDFEPTQFGDMQMMQITVEPLYLPLK